MSDKAKWGAWSVAFVWFTTHFGGGFASGRQLVDFYVQYGWYAIFTPVISVGIITLVLYYAWDFSVQEKLYDYRSWSVAYFKPLGPLEPLFSGVIEVMYLIILLLATGVAFATGGTLLTQQFPAVPYHGATVGLAVLIFILTIWGAETVRKAATVMAILIIAGMLVIYCLNMAVNLPAFMEILKSRPAPDAPDKGVWPAIWQSVKYAGLQCSLIGAYTAVADALHSKADVKKAAVVGFVINAGVMTLATTGVLTHYPAILAEKTPITYITGHGGGGEMGVALVSMIILLAVVSTGVGLIYGGARRVSTWWTKRTGASSRQIDIVSAAAYVGISWAVASFGLIPLIQHGYVWVGYASTPLVVVPIILVAFYRRVRAK